MAWLTEQQILALNPAALKAYALTLQTPLSAARGEIAALTELDSTEFADLPNIDPKKAVAAIQVCVKIANVRDNFGDPIRALSHAVGSHLVPRFPEKIGNPSDYTFLTSTLMGLQQITA
jgi:hypothetical protein